MGIPSTLQIVSRSSLQVHRWGQARECERRVLRGNNLSGWCRASALDLWTRASRHAACDLIGPTPEGHWGEADPNLKRRTSSTRLGCSCTRSRSCEPAQHSTGSPVRGDRPGQESACWRTRCRTCMLFGCLYANTSAAGQVQPQCIGMPCQPRKVSCATTRTALTALVDQHDNTASHIPRGMCVPCSHNAYSADYTLAGTTHAHTLYAWLCVATRPRLQYRKPTAK